MDIKGGYTFGIAGKPSDSIEDVAVPSTLTISLKRCGFHLKPVVKNDQSVEFGDILAETDGNTDPVLRIPSPASATISFDDSEKQSPDFLLLKDVKPNVIAGKYGNFKPEQITRETLCDLLVKGGIWPFFWSSKTRSIPSLTDEEHPRSIIINCLLTEPFRAKGKLIVRNEWNNIINGIKFLPDLLSENGTVEVVMDHGQDPIADMMSSDLAGFAWIKLHSVAPRYPIENPRLLHRLIKENSREHNTQDPVWVIDVQGVKALGMMLADGIPLHNRVIGLGGPGCPHPKHVSARIGTPLSSLINDSIDLNKVLVLRGGLVNGEPVDFLRDSVQYDDDAFFFLPKMIEREFLQFVRPGSQRRSIFPCFLSHLTDAPDKHITHSLRGEQRPCIICGMCEQVCPVNLLPQVLHRYIYRDALEEAEKMGLSHCIDCRLCTYICPSKIELADQFARTKEQIREEQLEQ